MMIMMRVKKANKKEELFSNRRIIRSIDTWRKDLSKMEEIEKVNTRLKKEEESNNRRYQLEASRSYCFRNAQAKDRNWWVRD